MQLLNPAMDDEEVKAAGLSKYAFVRTYVQVYSHINCYFKFELGLARWFSPRAPSSPHPIENPA